MSNPEGWNPLRWSCAEGGCYNVKHRPKIELFAECFSGRINFGDIDASLVEINSRALLMEWKSVLGEIPRGQARTYENLSRTGFMTISILVGNAETMEVSKCAFYAYGRFTGWRDASLADVRALFSRWELYARSLPEFPARTPVPLARMTTQEHAEWIADYEAHEHEFPAFRAQVLEYRAAP